MRATRRRFLRLSACALAGGLVAACGERAQVRPSSPQPPDPEAPDAPRVSHEPPALRDRVARGELPPVQERLPQNPLVLAPNEAVGIHGGALRRGFALEWGSFAADMRDGEAGAYTVPLFAQGLTAYGQDLRLRPNVCESWEQNDDATCAVYHLRKGVRWSDGEPLSSADARFYHDHVFADPDLSVTVPGADPEGVQLATPDDFTLEFHFARPNPFHPYDVARELPMQPAHYMQRWHASFTDRALLDQAAQGTMAGSWRGLYVLKSLWAYNPELPVLHTWVLAGDPREQRVVLERNPYFFQVDTAGQQLPYLDYLLLDRYDGPGECRDAALRGDLDLQSYLLNVADLPALGQAALDGVCRLLRLPGSWHLAMELNLAYQAEPLHALFSDRRVREALMLAIERDAINATCYDGLCEPRQLSPAVGSPYYDEALATGHVAWDPDRANALLDESGYAQRDADGYRTDPQGVRLSFRLLVTAAEGSPADRAAAMVCENLAGLGIECRPEGRQGIDVVRHVAANAVQAALTERDHMLLPIVSEHRRQFRTVADLRDLWAGAYLHHRLYGDAQPGYVAIEAPEGHWIRDLWALWDRIAPEGDAARRDELYAQVRALWRREIPLIGILGGAPRPLVVAHGLRNVREDLPFDLETGGLALQNPQQLFWERPEEHRYPEEPEESRMTRMDG